jgi:hypothetical protein
MKELINYARGLNAKDNVIQLIEKLYDNQNVSDFEHIIDYLVFKNFDDLSWTSYDLLLNKSNKWIKQLSKNVVRIDEEEGIDIKTVLDFEDGFRFVKLISEKSYKREGSLMSHCVASYYNRNVEIFSLRDNFNKPHCTIEKNMQIKGKGNGDISPKYVDYVVKFLEFIGMKVRDSEMEHLGYIVPNFLQYVQNDLYRNRYVRNNEQIVYSDEIVIFDNLEEAVNYQGNKISCLKCNADFRYSNIEDLGKLENIGGYADFRYSRVESLRSLKEIGGNVYFRDSKIENLGSLKTIGGYANFRYSNIEDLGSLKTIGGDADFRYSKVKNLGSLKTIGGYANFRYSEVEDLGSLKEIGGDAVFGNSKVENLGSLKTIGGYADFEDSNVESLGSLKEIGGFADFGNNNIVDLGSLKTISGDAYFRDSKVENLGSLKTIGGNVYFRDSKIESLLKERGLI